jgi:hypothetical protein
MNSGVPPTDLNARTGELTPPGITFRARAKAAVELSVDRLGMVGAILGTSACTGKLGWRRGGEANAKTRWREGRREGERGLALVCARLSPVFLRCGTDILVGAYVLYARFVILR